MGNRVMPHWAGVFAFVLVGSATALAQDYAVSSGTGLWVAPPSNAVDLGLTGDDSGFLMSSNTPWTNAKFPPFPISYYGRNFTTASQFGIMTNGYVQLGGTTSSGCCSPFAGASPPFTSGNTYDGTIAIAWNDDHSGNLPGKIYAWSDGTSPNRRFIIAYTNWAAYANQANSSLNFQVQFYEAAGNNPGRIVLAYNGSWTAGSYSYGVGIDEYQGANRFNRPPGPGSTSGQYTFTSTPPNDWIFDPKITTFTGTVLMDKYVVDGTGIGNTKELSQPASGLTVELRDSTGAAAASGVTNASGAFSMSGIALVGSQIGTLWITGQTPACAVRGITGGTAAGFQLASGVAFSADRNVGTLSITDTNDPGGTNRGPLNIASTIQGVYDWCATRTSKSIPFLEVLYDTSSSPTTYTKPGATAAQMRVSGASANPDAWDRSVIRRTYARHVLGAVSGYPSTGFDNTYDKVTDDANAFAEGFGYYLHFAVSGNTVNFYDGLSSSSSLTLNLEEPTTPLQNAASSSVAAWCALALYDLTDGANEPWDQVDGTGAAADRPFRTVAALATAPTASTFYDQWGKQGYDGVALSTTFIRHGMLTDDADEPNDLQTTSRLVNQFGFIRTARILNLYNEDWYSCVMPQPTNKLSGILAYDRALYNTTALFEIRDSGGALLATGASATAPAAYIAATGALPAGTYYLRVKHTGGVRLPTYQLSVFSELGFSAAALAPWTVGRPVNLPVNIKGGIPPYTLSIDPAETRPPGLILDGVNAKVTGVPSREGLYNFILAAGDSASPKNFAAGPQSFRVNPVLELQFGEFMGLAHDKDVNTRGAFAGGTAPYATNVDHGDLPGGVAIDALDIRFTGHCDVAGNFPLQLTSTDVAGSTATQAVTAVVCMESGAPADLAGGKAACGYWFDGVKGSVVKVAVKTAPKMPKRALRVQVLDADGVTALDAKTTAGKGKAAVAGFVAPSTGRYYVIVASDEGEPTQLIGAVKVAPTKKGAGENPDINFVAGKQYIVRLGALAGAKLTFTAKPDGSGLALKPIYLIDPDGQIHLVDANTELKSVKGAITITKTLDVSGTWQVLIGALPGPQGHFTYSYKIAEPKDTTYQFD